MLYSDDDQLQTNFVSYKVNKEFLNAQLEQQGIMNFLFLSTQCYEARIQNFITNREDAERLEKLNSLILADKINEPVKNVL